MVKRITLSVDRSHAVNGQGEGKYLSDKPYQGKSVIVTGASSGIGRALALRLADQGAWIALAARDAQRLDVLAAECRQRGGKAIAVPTDVTDEAQCKVLIERAVAEFGRLDVLINNAGIGAFFIILQGVILFLAAGRLSWTWAWVYLGICLVSVAVNGVIMLRTNPETIAERGQPEATQDWDKVIGGLWALLLYFVLPLVAGLDMRFDWTQELSAAWNLAGALVLAAGLGLGGWAMIANAYFSTAVRIQSDRGQTLCRSGPYRLVRHPGYLGFILKSLGTPLLLGLWWALLPGLVAVVLIVARTTLEDRFLQAELPGYRDYTQQVRYRLIPGVW